VEHLTDQNFDEKTAAGTVLVDFHANWCGPCKLLDPVLEALAAELKGSARIMKLDVDANHRIAERYSVSAIPYLLLLKDGEIVENFLGLQNAETLRLALRSA
jgi:thioredoxin